MHMFVYTEKDGKLLLKALKKHGIRAELIGTLPSNHDIDVVIDRTSIPSEFPELWLKVRLGAIKSFETDIGSLFILSKIYGHIDVFFQHPEKCPKCGTMCRSGRW